MSIPALVIALMWIMLWFLWPHGPSITMARKHIHLSPMVSFVSGTDNVFSKPLSFNTWKTSDESGEPVPVMPWLVNRPARCLEPNAPIAEEYASGRMAGIYAQVLRGMENYRPVWDDVPVFNLKTNFSMDLSVEISGDLKNRGFTIPDFLHEIKDRDKSWLTVLFVEVNGSGRVENVFLEIGTEYKEINSVVVKSAYRGSVSVKGLSCDGRVRLNYGAN